MSDEEKKVKIIREQEEKNTHEEPLTEISESLRHSYEKRDAPNVNRDNQDIINFIGSMTGESTDD